MIGFWLTAYFCGSIPFGLIIVRAVAGVDLRTVGSGNIGASNVGRAAGKTWGAIVLLLDALKGAGPTWAGPWLAHTFGADPSDLTAQVAAGTAAILGHMFPVWLGFRGGKGVATALGVAIVLAPWATLGAASVFAVLFAARRIVSLSSLAAAVTFAALQLWRLQPGPFGEEKWSLTLFSLAMPLLIIVRHAGNIARLLRGEESTYQLSGGAERPGGVGKNSTDSLDSGEARSGET